MRGPLASSWQQRHSKAYARIENIQFSQFSLSKAGRVINERSGYFLAKIACALVLKNFISVSKALLSIPLACRRGER